MQFKTLFRLVLVFGISIIMLGSCSSSKKLKKKCLDCPEFSQSEKTTSGSIYFNEKV